MYRNKDLGQTITRLLSRKGQGIVEYAVILAFCAVVGYAVHSMGFISIMSDSYNQKASTDYNSSDIAKERTTIAGNYGSVTNVEGAPDPVDFGRLGPGDFDQSNKISRLESDQIALGNIAELFLGKDNSYIENNLCHLDYASRNSIMVGWFRKRDDGTMYFLPKQLKQSHVENIFRWIQGDYGENGYTTSVDSTYRYLVSDYVTTNFEKPAEKQTGGNGLRIKFGYDGATQVVNSVTIAIDPLSQNDKNGSAGLQITVTKEEDGTIKRTVTKGGM